MVYNLGFILTFISWRYRHTERFINSRPYFKVKLHIKASKERNTITGKFYVALVFEFG